MIRGTQREMIMLRGERDSAFECVFFLVRRDVAEKKQRHEDMLAEANRLLGEMDLNAARPRKKRGFGKFMLWLSVFLLGAILGFAVALFI